MDELALIAQLRRALAEENAQAAWSAVQTIEVSLELDPRYSAAEKQLVRNLRSQVSDFIATKRDGLHPYAGATVTALESSIRKRTTGPDGWKLA
jgi:hypothetical protein